jgi:glycosyltransferase involved in cell wall biosynthesis
MDENISKSTNFPLVSVLLPVYNGEKYLSDTIKSILDQTYTNIELIIINDCSTDHSEEIILSFKDKRINYFKNEINLKLIKTLNKGVLLSKGKYIVRIDSDDIAVVDRIQKQVQFMECNSEYIVAGSYVQLIKNDVLSTDVINYHQFNDDIKFSLIFNCPFIHPSVIIRTSVFQELKITFNENFVHAEDYALWIELASLGKFYNIPEVLTYYRIHDEQISVKNIDFQINQMRKLQLIYLKQNLGNNFSDDEINDLFFSDSAKYSEKRLKLLLRFYQKSNFIGGYKERFLLNEIKNLFLEIDKLNSRSIFTKPLNSIYSKLNFSLKQKIVILLKIRL